MLPSIFSWIHSWQEGFPARMVLMSCLSTAWSVRLTANFVRKGGYEWPPWKGEEDYRWAAVRQYPGMQFAGVRLLFNLGFICLYQTLLIYLFSSPVLAAGHSPLALPDALSALAFCALLAIETVADNQQFAFQTEKHRLLRQKQPLVGEFARGFISSGLWQYSRHPNFFAEQGMWVVYYLFSVPGRGCINWSGVGVILLMLLFQGSVPLTERISCGKYPAYSSYQQKVGRLLPRLF